MMHAVSDGAKRMSENGKMARVSAALGSRLQGMVRPKRDIA